MDSFFSITDYADDNANDNADLLRYKKYSHFTGHCNMKAVFLDRKADNLTTWQLSKKWWDNKKLNYLFNEQ